MTRPFSKLLAVCLVLANCAPEEPSRLGAAVVYPASSASSVDTVAHLKSLVKPGVASPQVLQVGGYATAGDGGGGTFVWVPSSAVAEDGGIVLASTYSGAPAGRWWRVHSTDFVDVRWFGAVGDGSTDDSVAVQKAADVANAAGAATTGPRAATLHFPAGRWLVGTGSSAATWGDAYGGIKIGTNVRVLGDGWASRVEKTSGGTQNYVFRVDPNGAARVEFSNLAIDIKADANYQVGIFVPVASDIYVHDCLITNSLPPSLGPPSWTIHAILASSAHDVRWINNRTVRTQVKLPTSGTKTIVAGNTMINPFNQGFSAVIGGDGLESELQVYGNYIEGSADSGIFVGQDTGTTAGTFKDLAISHNTILGWKQNRGILARYGSTNSNWTIESNTVRGGSFASTTLASSTSTTVTVAAASGAQYPTSGWAYLEIGTVREELCRFTRSGDVFTCDHALSFTHANGSEFWGLTFAMVSNSLGIDVQGAADNAPGPMRGLRIAHNSIENVDQACINVAAANPLTEWSIQGNHCSTGRGIAIANATSTNLWQAGSIVGNTQEGYGIYSIYLNSVGGTHGPVLIASNVVRGDSTTNSIDGLRVEAANAGTLKVNVVGNVFTGQGGFSESAGIFEKTSSGAAIDGYYAGNDLRGNTANSATAASFTAAAVVRNNRGWVTEAKGTATITSGSTSVVVTHGLSVTPAATDISVTPTVLSTTDPGEIYVDTITSTQFTVHCRTNPGASNLALAWRAAVL